MGFHCILVVSITSFESLVKILVASTLKIHSRAKEAGINNPRRTHHIHAYTTYLIINHFMTLLYVEHLIFANFKSVVPRMPTHQMFKT